MSVNIDEKDRTVFVYVYTVPTTISFKFNLANFSHFKSNNLVQI